MCLFGHFEPFQSVRCRWDILVAEHFENSATDKNIGGIIIYQQDVEWCRLMVSEGLKAKRGGVRTNASFLLTLSTEPLERFCILARSGVSESPAGIRALYKEASLMGRARILSLYSRQHRVHDQAISRTVRLKRLIALAKFMLLHMKTNLASGCKSLIVFKASSSIISMSTKTKWKLTDEFKPSGKSFLKLSDSSASNRTGWQLKASKLSRQQGP